MTSIDRTIEGAARVILITSCKGGVGKSTCAANLGMAMAQSGRRTLVCDCNFDMRCLDLLFGVESDVVYDLYDAAKGRAPLAKTILRDRRCESLGFLAAPYSGGDEITSGELRELIDACALGEGYEYIILDTPGSRISPRILDTGSVTDAVVIASHLESSIRAADITGEQLARGGIENQRLIINCFDFDSALARTKPGINEIIDRSRIRLCGIVPRDRELAEDAENGEPVVCRSPRGNCATAFRNIAARLDGRYLPLFDGFSGWHTKRAIKRLIGTV